MLVARNFPWRYQQDRCLRVTTERRPKARNSDNYGNRIAHAHAGGGDFKEYYKFMVNNKQGNESKGSPKTPRYCSLGRGAMSSRTADSLAKTSLGTKSTILSNKFKGRQLVNEKAVEANQSGNG